MANEQKPQGKAQKGQGGKDSKLAKRNKNVTAALSDRVKEDALAAEVTKQMEEVETSFTPQEQAILQLRRMGWSFERIRRFGEKERKGRGEKHSLIPSHIERLRETRPEFEEEAQKKYNRYVEDKAEEVLRLASRMKSQRGLSDKVLDIADRLLKEKDPQTRDAIWKWCQIQILHGTRKVQAIHNEVGRDLQVAAARVSDKWGPNAEADREVIVFEPHGGWVPSPVP